MSNQPIDLSLMNDDRAVAPVIGVVILFGFLILALSLYQVEVVPQQNAEVEFQQFEETRNDLVELRAGILQAGSIDQPQYQTVKLGTTYPPRIFAINPPPPAGTIRTTDSYPITISNGSDKPEGTITIPTRFIQYRPGYNELDHSSTWYDASVLYVDARGESGGIAMIEDHELVNDDGEVRIVALQNEFRRSGTGRVTLELRPAGSVTGAIPEGDINVTVPTRLSGEEYWDGAIPSNFSNNYSITTDENGDGVHNLTLETTANNLTVDTVGVQEEPEDPTQNDNARIGSNTGGDGSDGGGSEGNTQAEQVSAVDGTTPNGKNQKQLEFDIRNNGATTVTISDFNISTPNNNGDTQLENINDNTPGNNKPEVKIGGADSANTKNKYNTDGTTYPLNSSASLNAGDRPSVTMGEFNGGEIQLTYDLTDSETNADITVALIFDDGSAKEFYFEVTNIKNK